jgi:glycerophosphoryl diester phosphodiesterase
MRRARAICTGAFVGVALLAGLVPAADAHRGGGSDEPKPLVIGHRGAPGYLPEHTLQSYALAIKLGADYVEPDLVATKDGYLIARHEPNITNTTDVRSHPEFANRERTVTIDGVPQTGFFASDFTLAEIKTLRAVQTFAGRPDEFNGRFQIPTLDEVIALVKRESRKRHRRIGIYPETKHPTYHKEIGLPLEGRLVRTLRNAGWNGKRAPVFIQSFEQSNLKQLNRITGVRLVQLVDAAGVSPTGELLYEAPSDRPYDWTVSGDPELLARTYGFFATNAGLREIRSYADGIGPWKRYIVSSRALVINPDGTAGDANGDGLVDDADRVALPHSDLIQRAHQHGLKIHSWTFRNEQSQLLSNYGGHPAKEYLQFYNLGIDGVFSDYPDTAFASRELFRLQTGEE